MLTVPRQLEQATATFVNRAVIDANKSNGDLSENETDETDEKGEDRRHGLRDEPSELT